MAGMVVIDGGKSEKVKDSSKKQGVDPEKSGSQTENPTGRPSTAQARYLKMGLDQPGGKLPLFDASGQEIKAATIKSCVEKGWAEPWFNNPLKPDWLVCKLTEAGRIAVKNM